MRLIEVEIGDAFYKQACEIRRNHLFKNIDDVDYYMNDPWEKKSIHVIVEHKGRTVGVGRLTYDDDGNGIISQMAVLPMHQKKNVGSMILEHFIKLCIYNSSEKVYMSAREAAIGFYEKFGFNTIGSKFASPKTGITHVSMVLVL